MKDVMIRAVTGYTQVPRTQWVIEWPGQVVIAASSIYWTADVSNAIVNGTLKVSICVCEGFIRCEHPFFLLLPSFPQEYLDLSNHQIDDIVELVRGKLSRMARITLGALTVIDVHGRRAGGGRGNLPL